MNRFFGGGSGLTNQPSGLDVGIPSGGGSNIKSIQSGTKVTTLASDTQAISAVNPSNCLLLMSFYNAGPDGTVDKEAFYGEITSATQLTFTRTTAGGSESIAWQLIEFNNIKSRQSGIYTTANNTNEQLVAISSVVPAKSIIVAQPFGNTGAADLASIFIKYRIANSSQIAFQGTLNGTNIKKMAWQVLEFN